MKKYFKIQLLDGAGNVSLCKDIVLLAAQSNGGDKPKTLQQLKTVAEGQQMLYPVINECTVELIGDCLLHIDTKIRGEYKTVCVIEECELYELEIPEHNGIGALAE